MIKAMNFIESFFIKRIYFPGEDSNTITELISVTKEVVHNVNGVKVVTPEILSSCICDINAEDLKEKGLDPLEVPDNKKFISREQAMKLTDLVEDQDSFHKAATDLF
ncbi:hypothetical protein D1B31_17845 [Neobacillus notoginsengisoli]|uniref:Uncharacterized protein n=1 Tax=Neobacillus notoginsengisoli TaxID=1578198 RepID=A0A417YPN8_9BACI|nr:hypothetical protein [Neobacillus notoginsengisoli]RHW35955.1 hypothetical protein D1B31_17845 [Neobacillus notoginsengisoli]